MRPVICDVFGVASGSANRLEGGSPHRHQEVELTFAEQGMVTYLFGREAIPIHSGQLAVFWAAIPHRLIMMEKNTTLHWLTIPLGHMLQWRLPAHFTQRVMDGLLVLDHSGACAHFDQRIFQRWHNDLAQSVEELQAIVLLECEACLRRLALSLNDPSQQVQTSSAVLNAAPVTNSSTVDWQRAERAADFIATHYQHPLPINNLAQELGLHPHSAMRLFQKFFGVSIVEYITQYRLAHAQRLLATTDASVLEISTASGFGSLSHFYSVFTRACGRSPQAYRQSLSSYKE